MREHASAPRTERGAYRELTVPRVGADEQQVRDVGTRHQQHEQRRGGDHPERAPGVTNDVVAHWRNVRHGLGLVEHHLHRHARRQVRRYVDDTRQYRREVALRRLDRYMWLQSSERVIVETARKGFVWIELQWQPEIGARVGKAEALGHHADDLGQLAGDDQLLADRVWLTSKSCAP